MCLNIPYNDVRIVNLWCISYSEWPETRRCLIPVSVQLYFRILHENGPRKAGGTEIERNTSSSDPC
jgi:hypothetical protein